MQQINIDKWIEQLKLLPNIAESELKGAYSAFSVDLRENWLSLCEQFWIETEDIIRFTFIPAINGDYICCDYDQILLSFPKRFDGLCPN